MGHSTRARAIEAAPFALPPMLVGVAAVTAFREEAMALPQEQLVVCAVDPSVMRANVNHGVASVLPRLAEAVAKRPKTQVARVLSLPNLSRAVEHLASNAVAPVASRAQIEAKYAELMRYRGPALFAARALASELFALLPIDRVRCLEMSAGVYLHALDALSLAAMLRAPAVLGRHPFSESQLRAMESLGAWLAERVAPEPSRPASRHHVIVRTALRDRMWALLRRYHAELRRVGLELFGEEGLDAHVPRLNARLGGSFAVNDNDLEDPKPR